MASRWVFNCEEEYAHFERLLKFETSHRVLAVEAGEDMGRTHLLGRFAETCRTSDPGVPTAIVDFKESRCTEPFGLVGELAFQLAADVDELELYHKIKSARDSGTWTPSAGGTVDARGLLAGGSQGLQIAGTNVEYAQQVINNAPRGELPPDAKRAAAEECVRAFLDALMQHCAKGGSLVLMLDTFELCPSDVRRWVEGTFLRSHFFRPERPERLMLVLAGSDLPPFHTQFSKRLCDETLVSVTGLGRWKPSDIEEGLRRAGEEVPDDIDLVYRFLDKPMTTADLVTAMLSTLIPEGR